MIHRQRQQILVVARSAELARRLVSWLEKSGFTTTLAKTLADAKALLERKPDLVLSEVKLGEYNGLHLALRAEAAGIPTVLLGPEDTVLQRDAQTIPAVYLTTVTRSGVLGAVATQLSACGVLAGRQQLAFHARATTVAAEAEAMWSAFCQSPALQLNAFGRTMLPS